MLEQNKQKNQRQSLLLILVSCFLLRLFLATATDGYVYDINCFFAWGLRMAELGAGDFYAADYFCDYPPAYLYILGLVGHCLNLFGLNYQDKLAQVCLVFVPSVADTAIAWLVYHIACKEGQGKWALRLAGFAAFCPMFWYDTAVWKQIDGVLSLLLLGCFYLLAQKRFVPAAALFGLALAVKPQALIVGPVFALCFLLPLFFAKDTKAFWQAIKAGALGIVAALAPLYLCALPFFGFGNTASGLLSLYTTTASSYPYASINGFNFMVACGGNWVGNTEPFTLHIFGKALPFFFSWATFGKVAILLLTLLLVLLALRAHKNKVFSPALLGAVYMIAIFTFGHSMHERYLLLGVVLLLYAMAQFGNTRLLALAGGFSLTCLLNMAMVYTLVETDDSFLTSDTSVLAMRSFALIEVLLCLALLYEVWQICSGKRGLAAAGELRAAPSVAATPVPKGKAAPKTEAAPMAESNAKTAKAKGKAAEENAPREPYRPAPQPSWSKREKIFVLALTLAVAVLSFAYLGDFTAPQNPLDLREGSTTETVLVSGEAASLWVYPGVIESGATLTLYDESGMAVLELSLAVGSLFQWESYDIPSSGQYTVSVAGVQMMELGFKDAAGNLLPVSAVSGTLSALFDEQSLIPEVISQLNSFYFDEIYHARTAYESTQGMDIYEISHPPMGKNFIALGILIFGMTGFGWRFAGVLFGVLLVPVIYWLTRRLSRSARAAGLVALLLSFDFMRYTQSRIATIDTISAFFILLGATCMVWYCQSVLEKGVRKSVLPMALAGLCFGFGAASKWTGLYAGVGLAVLYFGVLALRLYQQKQALAPSGKISKKTVARAQQFKEECRTELLVAFGGGVLFFVIIPLIIYIASYLPYKLADPSFGWLDLWQNQDYMLWYHSTLDATHPFSSSWYSWFLDLRPVWYYMGSGLESGTYASIAGFYNPILCWVGALAWLRLCYKALVGKGSLLGNALIVLLLSQLLPWLLVTRCTFLYHYYPSFLFTVVAIGLWFKDALETDEARAYTLASGLLTLVVFFFIWFYPVLSGLPIGTLWAQTLKLLPSYGFYIIS